MKRIGLLAGVGGLPVEFARAARGMGFTVIAVGVVPGVNPDLNNIADTTYHIGVGQLDEIITTLQREGVREITMLGKVTKELMFTGTVALDRRMQKVLASLPDNSDDTIMLAFVKEFLGAGFQILDQTALLKTLMPAPGVLTSREPSKQEQADMEFGFKMAKEMGGLDIGQTVVVKKCAVMAVEAIEGTDACIRRGGELGRGGITVAKTAKPSQDQRFDVPTVGLATLKTMCEVGAVALVIEAGKVLLIDRDKVLQMANDHNITILAM